MAAMLYEMRLLCIYFIPHCTIFLCMHVVWAFMRSHVL
jgi:hypothetical protein